MLESGDRALDVGKGGLEMGEDFCGRLVCGIRRRLGRRLGRRAAAAQGGADLALCQVEAFPDALRVPIAELIEGTAGGEDAMGNSALQKPPQGAGGEAEPTDFVGEPDAESPPATRTRPAVAAKDPLGADCLSRAALVKSAQNAVLIQRADNLAMRTGRLLQPFHCRQPFAVVTEKPSLFPHGTVPPRKSEFYPGGAG
jgi:hypothetical protein